MDDPAISGSESLGCSGGVGIGVAKLLCLVSFPTIFRKIIGIHSDNTKSLKL